MKSEAEIRKILDYLDGLYHFSFNDDTYTYTSVFADEKTGQPEVFDGEESSAVLGNLQIALTTLKWILEEAEPMRLVKNANEPRLYKGKIMYDGDGIPYIPDNSAETFICGIEGRY
jgi:hypothetical protein